METYKSGGNPKLDVPAKMRSTRTKRSKKLFEILISGGIIAVILAGIITIAWDTYQKSRSDWAAIDNNVQSLIYVILDADQSAHLSAPPYTSTRNEKIRFIRESQIAIHADEWKALGSQIPQADTSDDVQVWNDAISGHTKIEKAEHPLEFSNLMLKARWETLVAQGVSQTTLNGEMLKLAESPALVCTNCAQTPTIKIKISSGIQSQSQVSGVAVDELPYKGFSTYYPVFEINSNQVSASTKPAEKHRYLIPSFQSLMDLKQQGTLEIDEHN